MIKKVRDEYEPDYVFPPGDTLKDVLDSLNMSQAELARRAGRPFKTINEIIKGKTIITPETALQLERVLKVPANFWNNREKQYREFLAKMEEQREMGRNLNWLQNMPIKEMIKIGWIEKHADKSKQLIEVLKFFGVAGPEQWEQIWNAPEAVYRKSKAFKSNPYALSAWLRQGEIIAQNIQCSDYDERCFKSILQEVRGLTGEGPDIFVPRISDLCAQSGVAVVFVPEIRGASVSGATRWLNSRKALIQLSLRYKTNDYLWFTFFHEAGHILLHGKREFFIETGAARNPLEEAADAFSSNFLIPKREYNSFLVGGNFGRNSVSQFAQKLDVAPGVVVGRLQHDEFIPYSNLNQLKKKFRWVKNDNH